MKHQFVLVALAVASILLPGATLAQEPAAPSPEAIAQARAAGDAIIAAAGAEGVFVNETTDNTIEIRHPASNLVCRFEPRDDNRIIVITQNFPRGEDVACDMPMGRMSTTFYATRVPGATAQSELRGAVGAIKSRWPKARTWKPSGRTAELLSSDRARGAMQGTETAWFKVIEHGHPMVTRVSVVVINGWVIKMRATAPEGDAPIIELLLDVHWLATVLEAREPGSMTTPAPTAAS